MNVPGATGAETQGQGVEKHPGERSVWWEIQTPGNRTELAAGALCPVWAPGLGGQGITGDFSLKT